MPATQRSQKSGRHLSHSDFSPSKVQCMKILRHLARYVDHNLAVDEICREIRKQVGPCPNCKSFVLSLRQTITLCQNYPPRPLSSADKAELRRHILKAAGASPGPN